MSVNLNIAAADRRASLEDAGRAARNILDVALTSASVTAADVRACVEAAVSLDDGPLLDRASEVLLARMRAYGPTDISASAARDFAAAWRTLRDHFAPEGSTAKR